MKAGLFYSNIGSHLLFVYLLALTYSCIVLDLAFFLNIFNMVMSTFPVRDDDRMERRRQRAIGLRRRYGKRQGVVAGAPDEVEEEKEVESEESGSESESDSEDEDETKSNTAPSAQTQTSSPPSTIAPPSQATATNVLATESTSAAAITASVS